MLDQYPTMYFPAAFTPSGAAVITVASGEQYVAADIHLSKAKGAVAGVATGPDAAGVQLSLVPRADGGPVSGVATLRTVTRPDGSFTFRGVPAGLYDIRVLMFAVPRGVAQRFGGVILVPRNAALTPPGETRWADVPVDVADQPVEDVRVALRHGARFRGALVFEGPEPRPSPGQLGRLPILVQAVDWSVEGPMPLCLVAPDGSFATPGLPNGRYLLRMLWKPPGWTLVSVRDGERGVSGTPLELRDADVAGVVLTLTDRPTVLTGSVLDGHGAPARGVSIYAFPTDRALWAEAGSELPIHIVNTTSLADGTYTVSGLPPGRYFVTARAGGPPEDWGAVASLTAMVASSATVRLRAHEQTVLNLRLVSRY